MKKVEEFEWEWTKRKIIVVVPYYGNRIAQMTYALSKIKTELPDSDWGIIVCDDGCDHDISIVEEFKNVRTVRVRNATEKIRNGCLCRNVAIRRCLSEWIVSTDPEVVWSGDFLSKIYSHKNRVVRIRKVRTLSSASTENLIKNNKTPEDFTYKFYDGPYPDDTSIEDCEIGDRELSVKGKRILPHIMHKWGIHYGFALESKYWHILRGYDERIEKYGPDDFDIMRRALLLCRKDVNLRNTISVMKNRNLIPVNIKDKFNLTTLMLDDVFATHLHHELVDHEKISYKKEISEPGFIRNDKTEWGMLYDR